MAKKMCWANTARLRNFINGHPFFIDNDIKIEMFFHRVVGGCDVAKVMCYTSNGEPALYQFQFKIKLGEVIQVSAIESAPFQYFAADSKEAKHYNKVDKTAGAYDIREFNTLDDKTKEILNITQK